ncbi:YqzK family protein [Bacillus songklensis]|uniref:YqzK family protein n=1 Tax=Bacillus songklensis TaxID=1069116 RepID=A0ABV8AYS0_9BACI
MKTFIQLIYQTLKVFVLFTGFTLLFYYGMIWVHQEYQQYQRYDEPQGSAVKVANIGPVQEQPSWIERLFLFYHSGE